MALLSKIPFLLPNVLLLLLLQISSAQEDATYFSLDEALKKPEKVYRLDLSYQNLTEFPLSIFKLTQLKRLNLSHNQIESIPEKISELTDLRRLIISNNKISNLPDGLFTLKKIKKLYLSNNQLNNLSSEISNLTKLKRLFLDGNNLTSLPDEIGTLADLEQFSFDQKPPGILSPFLDSCFKAKDFENWNRLKNVPDSIGGRPMSYYLEHEAIDDHSKEIVRGLIVFDHEMESLGFLDSIYSSNRDITPYYFYVFSELDQMYFAYRSQFDRMKDQLCESAKIRLLKDPCLFISDLLSNNYYTIAYKCLHTFFLDENEKATVLSTLKKNCPDLYDNKQTLYEQLNHLLPFDLYMGSIVIQNEVDETPVYYNNMSLLVKGPSNNSFENVGQYTRFKRLTHTTPGKYSFHLYPTDLVKSSDLNSIPVNSALWRIDTVINSFNTPVNIEVRIQYNLDSSMIKTGDYSDLESTIYREYNRDRDRTSNGTSGDCSAYKSIPTSEKLVIFRKEVLSPALRNNLVSSENKALLKDIEAYLIKKAEREAKKQSSINLPYPVYFAYKSKYKSGSIYTSLFSDNRYWDNSSYGNWQEEVTVDASEFYKIMVNQPFYIYYSNSSVVKSFTVRKYDDYKDACRVLDTYPLYETDSTDQRRPAFACRHKISLSFGDYKSIDKLLEEKHNCDTRGSYCDVGWPPETYASLQGVPGIYFTATDVHADDRSWFDYYPSRSIYMLTKDGKLIELWQYNIEHVECSCI